MTPCIGWPADPPCGVYDAMHGCALGDGHAGRHVCACAAHAPSLKAQRTPRVAHCGTDSGYYRHRRNGEAACESCLEAHTRASARWQAKNRGAVNWGRAQSREAAA